jgi:hypothetical protein
LIEGFLSKVSRRVLVIAIAFWLYGSYLTYRSDGQAQALQTFLAPLGFAFVIALYSALDRLSLIPWVAG